ncbi:hypothetical protein VTN02DRAFT_321 [Thermoascus thermophilus]
MVAGKDIEYTSFEDVLDEFSRCAVDDQQQKHDSDYNDEGTNSWSVNNDDTASLLKTNGSQNHGREIFIHRRIPKRHSRANPPKDPSRLHPWWVTREEAQILKAQQKGKEKQRRERSRSPSSRRRRRRRRSGEKEDEGGKEADKCNGSESRMDTSRSKSRKKQRTVATSPELPSISEDRAFELQQSRRSLSRCSLQTISLTSLLPYSSSAPPADFSRPTIRIVTSTDNGNGMTNGDRKPASSQEMMGANNKENNQKSFKMLWEMIKK